MAITPPTPTIYKCLVHVDGVWVNGECRQVDDGTKWWLVKVDFSELPTGKIREMVREAYVENTLNRLAFSWGTDHAFRPFDGPMGADFRLIDGHEKLKVLYGETVYV